MRHIGYIAFFAPLFLSFFFMGATPALANTTNLSFDLSYANQPFSFYCQPYKYSFVSGNHYVVPNNSPCFFTIPSDISGTETIELYKGVPGNSTIVSGDVVSGPNPTLVKENNSSFGTPLQDQDYFAVIYGYSTPAEAAQFDAAFRTSSSTNIQPPTNDFHILQWKWGGKPVSEYEPVVIIPGILGSWEKNGDWVLDPIAHTYDNLVDTFLANGYVDGKTLFKFPYDWEEPNEVTASLLAAKIQSIKQTCGCQRVNLVAHSMGGLVAEQYIESQAYKNDVDNLVFIATPLMGAPEAYKAWEGGDVDFGNFVMNSLMQRIFTREAFNAGYNSTFDYIRSKPVSSIKELLPVDEDYLYDNNVGRRTYPTGYPVNGFLETLLTNIRKATQYIEVTTILGDDQKYHTPDVYFVQDSTQPPKWPDGEVTDTVYGAGDGTVPRESIENLFTPDKEFDGVNHVEIASTSAPYIFRQFNNKDPNIIVGKDYQAWRDADYSILAQKLAPSSGDFRVLAETVNDFIAAQTEGAVGTVLNNPLQAALLIMLYSPINVEITAPDGTKVGRDLTTGTSVDEIPSAIYSGPIGEHEYVLIPNPLPGMYKVQTIGTGNGSYTVATGYINASTTSESLVTGTTTLDQIINNTLILSSTTTVVTITTDTLTPPSDTQPPVIVIANPTTTKQYTHLDTIKVAATITDQSPIATTTYRFNGKLISSSTPISLAGVALGTSTVTVSATDKFGNMGSSSVSFQIVATPESCKWDLALAYKNKWIGKKAIYDGLINDCDKLNQLFRDRDTWSRIPPPKRDKKTQQSLTATLSAIQSLCDDIGKWINDKSNAKDAIQLLNQNLQWFKSHQAQ